MAATLTMVTAATGNDAPPGTVMRKLKAPAVPTQSAPSQTPIVRSNSVSSRKSSRSSMDSVTPKALSSAA